MIIKPCPFCVSTNVVPRKYGDEGLHHVTCEFCGANGPWARAEVDAIRMWNRRDKESYSGFLGEEG